VLRLVNIIFILIYIISLDYKVMKNDKKTGEINAATGASSADEGDPIPDIGVKLAEKPKPK
jgi:hypothetical protein